MPLTMPVPEPMEAIAELLLVQAPPPEASVNVVVLPVHTEGEAGIMAEGAAITVTAFIAEQPDAFV